MDGANSTDELITIRVGNLKHIGSAKCYGASHACKTCLQDSPREILVVGDTAVALTSLGHVLAIKPGIWHGARGHGLSGGNEIVDGGIAAVLILNFLLPLQFEEEDQSANNGENAENTENDACGNASFVCSTMLLLDEIRLTRGRYNNGLSSLRNNRRLEFLGRSAGCGGVARGTPGCRDIVIHTIEKDAVGIRTTTCIVMM